MPPIYKNREEVREKVVKSIERSYLEPSDYDVKTIVDSVISKHEAFPIPFEVIKKTLKEHIPEEERHEWLDDYLPVEEGSVEKSELELPLVPDLFELEHYFPGEEERKELQRLADSTPPMNILRDDIPDRSLSFEWMLHKYYDIMWRELHQYPGHWQGNHESTMFPPDQKYEITMMVRQQVLDLYIGVGDKKLNPTKHGQRWMIPKAGQPEQGECSVCGRSTSFKCGRMHCDEEFTTHTHCDHKEITIYTQCPMCFQEVEMAETPLNNRASICPNCKYLTAREPADEIENRPELVRRI